VVILDDEKAYAETTAQLIGENLQVPVHVFSSPKEALKKIKALDPAVIVTDYLMPEMGGLDFVKKASVVVPGAAFILITGHLYEVSEQDLDGITALTAYLHKPFGWRRLGDEIVRVWPSDDKPSLPPRQTSTPFDGGTA
jgi:DNA-binding NtrC family response regulator